MSPDGRCCYWRASFTLKWGVATFLTFAGGGKVRGGRTGEQLRLFRSGKGREVRPGVPSALLVQSPQRSSSEWGDVIPWISASDLEAVARCMTHSRSCQYFISEQTTPTRQTLWNPARKGWIRMEPLAEWAGRFTPGISVNLRMVQIQTCSSIFQNHWLWYSWLLVTLDQKLW